MRRLLLLLLSSLCTQVALEAAQWPQGSGPAGNWAATGPAPPLHFSVRTGENILWQTPLPETGQGGIAVHSGRIFLTCMAPWSEDMALSAEDAALYSHAIEKRKVSGKDTIALCLDQQSGEILWSHTLEGSVPSIYTYPFSDATSASPVTDGKHVWFTNAGGQVACFTIDGTKVWERRWTPTFDGPFNKQYEPFLVPRPEGGAVFVTMEPFQAPGPEAEASLHGRWHHLVGLDAASGEVLWTSADTLTHYNAPTLVATTDGPCLLHARGGPHQVPELPLGISLTRLTGERAGEAVWRFEDPRKNHEASLQTMAYDEQHVYWLLKAPHNSLIVLDRNTGKELREISLVSSVTCTSFDTELGKWHTDTDVALDKPVFPARYSMIAAGGHVTFQCYATAWGKPNIGPPYSFARVNPASGLVEYLEVPSGVVRTKGIPPSYLWRTPRSARPLNSRGIEVTGDDRCRWDGWDWVFNGSPTRVNDRLYFTLASGLVYVLDASAEHFDGRAFLALGDLGPADGVWTANSISYTAGQLYHRTGAALIAIGNGQADK